MKYRWILFISKARDKPPPKSDIPNPKSLNSSYFCPSLFNTHSMKRLIASTLFLSLVSIGIYACKNEPKIEQADLLGRWELREGFRNEQKSEDLAGLFFEFFGDGKMITNMSGSTAEAQYELKKQMLLQRGGEMDADYQIETLNDTSLTLIATLREINFRFVLGKSIQVN